MSPFLLNQIFGPMEEDHPLVKSFTRKIKDLGISGESFRIVPENILSHGKENWKPWKTLSLSTMRIMPQILRRWKTGENV
jgi:hypothetical protein